MNSKAAKNRRQPTQTVLEEKKKPNRIDNTDLSNAKKKPSM